MDKPRSRKPQLFKGLDVTSLMSGEGQTFECNINVEDYEDLEVENDRVEDADYTSMEVYKKMHIDFINEPFAILAAEMTSVDKQNLVKKMILAEGKGPVVDPEATVILHYNMYYEGQPQPFDSTYVREEPLRIRYKEAVIPGMAMAIETMRLGEKARFLISWQVAFGRLGCVHVIPEKADVLADVELLQIVPFSRSEPEEGEKEQDVLTPFREQMHSARVFQNDAKRAFKKKAYGDSIKFYKEGLRVLEPLAVGTATEKIEKEQLVTTLHLNLAVVYNNSGNPALALKECESVFTFEPDNQKAIFHFGKAHLLMDDFKTAGIYLKRGQTLYPDCKAFQTELKLLDSKKSEKLAEEKDLAKKMTSKLGC